MWWKLPEAPATFDGPFVRRMFSGRAPSRLLRAAFLTVALAGIALPADTAPVQRSRADWQALYAKERRAYELRPQRRDAPLRYLNISDDEIREIQTVAVDVVPQAIVNVSAVVVGCSCEDGPGCSEQVWILAERPGKTVGLQLSKIDGSWVVGPVQQWWLNFEDLERRSRSMKFRDYEDARDRMFEAFPSCKGPAASEPSKRDRKRFEGRSDTRASGGRRP